LIDFIVYLDGHSKIQSEMEKKFFLAIKKSTCVLLFNLFDFFSNLFLSLFVPRQNSYWLIC